MSNLVTIPIQGELLLVECQAVIDDVEMGVLNTGEPYLTGRGLARMCGIDHTALLRLATNWQDEQFKPRGKKIIQLLSRSNYPIQKGLFQQASLNGQPIHAYTEPVCLAILEYYAFEASEKKERAQNTFRLLAARKFREFIYEAVGYHPYNQNLGSWKQFHDRLSLIYDSVPTGYFGIFKEISDMIVHLGQAGLYIDSSFVPDISVGLAWSKYWKDSGLDAIYGERIHYQHNYPEYFPQAKSNPQEPWCYPETALGEFRRWLRDNYIKGGKFSKYINGKVRDKELPPEFGKKAIEAYKE